MSPRRATWEEMRKQPWNLLHVNPEDAYEPLEATVRLAGSGTEDSGYIRFTLPKGAGFLKVSFPARAYLDVTLFDVPVGRIERFLLLPADAWEYVDLFAHSWIDAYPDIDLRVFPEDLA